MKINKYLVAILAPVVALLGFVAITITPASAAAVTLVGSSTFANGGSGSPTAALPSGATVGDILVATVETYPFAKITFPTGWTKVNDVSTGANAHVASAWKVVGPGEPKPKATVSPATQVSYVVADFRGAATVSGFSAAKGKVSPVVGSPGDTQVATIGGSDWVTVAKGTPSGLVATVNDKGNSFAAIAVGAGTWSTTPAASDTVAGTLALSPVGGTPTTTATSPTSTTTSPTSTTTSPTSTTTSPTSTTTSPTSTTTSPTSTATPPPNTAPTAGTPICDTPGLNGPSSAPAGAVTVGSDNLATAVNNAPAGTTFWLTAGTHVLGGGQFNQVTPKNNDVFLGAPGAILDGQHSNNYAFGGNATGVKISYLTVQNFGQANGNNGEGVVNHDSATGWVLQHNTLQLNAGAGTMMGDNNVVDSNCLRNNGEYGFNAYSANDVHNITLSNNEISGNNTDNWEARVDGCGCAGGGKFWATTGAVVTGNFVHDNKDPGLWADTNNSGFLFDGNYISNNDGQGILYETSYNANITNNTFVKNGLVGGPSNPGFPTGAIYISESGSDTRAPGSYGGSFKIQGNVFTDNYSGVIAWENADRFCGSPANTSSDTCTLVNPSVVTVNSCNQSNISKSPYFSDCRWKTQNLDVSNNTFNLTPANVGPKCTPANGCGFNGIFSEYGTYPSWSPYKAEVVEDAITFNQNNKFSNNVYNGPWQFMVHDQNNDVSFATWQGTYGQDVGSTH